MSTAASTAAAQGTEVPPGLLEAAGPAGEHARPLNSSASRARHVRLDVDLLDDETLLLNLFDDASFVAQLQRRVSRATGTEIWIGNIPGIPFSQVVLAERDGVVAGTVRWAERLFEINPAGRGRQTVEEIDGTALPPHRDPIPVAGARLEPAPLEEGGSSAAESTAAAGTVVDMMIVYTEASRARYNPSDGGVTGIETRIEAAVADFNQANLNSQVDIQISLVHMELVGYDETTGDMEKSLNDLTGTSDGRIDAVHGLRDTYGADLVSLITEDGGYCGIAWVMQNVSTGFAGYGFSVVYSSCLSSQTLAHEAGHNKGNMHDRANSSFGGAYPYSYGYQNTGNWRTIMAYSNGCGGCFRIDHFANPNVLYGATPTGIDHDADAANSADNARSMNNTAATVAAFRASAAVNPPAAPSALSANPAAHDEIALAWNDTADNEASFEVERAPDGVTWTQIASLAPNAEAYSDGGLTPETGYSYRVRAVNGAGSSAWSNTASATTPGAPPFVDEVAVADLPVAGSVSNSYGATQDQDDVVQAIGERESGGKKQSRYSYLEHKWRFDVTGGASVVFYANAYMSVSSDNDSFIFSYSTNDSNYTEMFTVTTTSDDDSYQTYQLPASTSGTLYVRVIDSDRSAGNKALDTLYVDHLFLRSETGGGSPTSPPATPSGLAANAQSSSAIDLGWTDGSGDEMGFEIESSLDQSSWQMIATTSANATGYSDTNLDSDTTYYYRVHAYNAGGPSADVTAQATTMVGSNLSLSAFGYKTKGRQNVDLTWSGASTANVEVRRDGILIATTANDGAYSDNIGKKGGGSYSYEVCETGGGACSDPATVVF